MPKNRFNETIKVLTNMNMTTAEVTGVLYLVGLTLLMRGLDPRSEVRKRLGVVDM